ncbi:BspA family leucine-rich repeat surface protein [Flagellimonas baculiformis]|uniref:BspA family leucine-rich repeat surface protein n=1 Tax=Flagellimonas baculiformis TaxID=3067310 RepID=UPI00296EBBB7|nr:BspA family leucine-rich repeat surface protein [Muricauda sp. D6]
MKKATKSFGTILMTLVLVWSCSKDDGPAPPSDEVNGAPVMAAQEFTAKEDIADTKVIGTVKATDPDGDKLAFTLKADNDGLFEISAAGELSLAAGKALDFENKAQHTITVEVGDGEKTATATVTIKVTNVSDSLAEDPTSFITTWKTTVANEEIYIMTSEGQTYNYTIDWGDGTVEQITNNGKKIHAYSTPGTHTMAIKGELPWVVFATDLDDPNALKLLSVEQWGSNQWKSMNSTFALCSNMVLNATDIPDLSQVSDMGLMFYGATSFNGDISGWDTSNVADMTHVFSGATAFDQNLGNWDISNVTNMNNMLDNSGMSVTNLRDTLVGWNAFVTENGGPKDVVLGIEGLVLCSESIIAANNLAASHGWTFEGTYTGQVNCE